MMIGNRQMDLKNHCHVMGILNVTPDSFSDGGNIRRWDARAVPRGADDPGREPM